MVLCLIRNARCILQAPGFRTALSRDWVFSQMEFIPPLSERKRNATPDRWMTDESFPFMRLRMLTLICCHVSPWLKCVCVYELVWERQKSEKKEERGWECDDEILAALFLSPSNFPLRGSHAPSPIYPASVTVLSPCFTTWQVCLQKRAQ